MKKIGVFILALIGVIISAFTFQFGWNAIVTTIIPINKISIWQAFGLDITLSLVFPDYYKEKKRYRKLFRTHNYKHCKNFYLYVFNLVS